MHHAPIFATPGFRRRVVARSTSIVTLALLFVACGSPAKPPAAEGQSPARGNESDAGAPSSDAGAPSSDAGAPLPAASAGSDATPDAPSTAHGEIRVDDADDACQSAGIAFEKRARPAIKACYREGRKKDANLAGGVRITVGITNAGTIGAVLTSRNGDRAMLPAPVVTCMLSAVKATPPADVGLCKNKSLSIPVQFPTQ